MPSNPSTLAPDAWSVLKTRTGRFDGFRAQKLAEGPLAETFVVGPKSTPEPTTVSAGKMTATCVLTTEDPDRSGDVVVTAGIETDNHRRAPIVLFDHGKDPARGKRPVGKAEAAYHEPDAEGQDAPSFYSVKLFADRGFALGTTTFRQNDAYVLDLFRLIEEGLMPGASIGFRPLEAELMPGSDPENPSLFLKRIELIEYSHTPMPDNADALLVRIEKGYGGKRFDPDLAAALKKYCPTPAACSRGVLLNSEKGIQDMAGKASDDPNKKYVDMDADGNAVDDGGEASDKEGGGVHESRKGKKGMNETSGEDGGGMGENDYEDRSQQASAGKKGKKKPPQPGDAEREDDTNVETESEPTAEPAAGGAADPYSEGPPGAHAARAVHDRLMDVVNELKTQMGRQENPRIRELMDNLSTSLDGMSQEIMDTHASEYPDQEPLAGLTNAADLDEAELEDGEAEEDAASGVRNGQKKTKGWTPAQKALFARLEIFEKARQKRNRTGLHLANNKKVIVKCCDFLDDLSEHRGMLTEGHRRTAKAHSAAMRKCMKDVDMGDSDGGDMEESMSAKAWKAKYEKVLATHKNHTRKNEQLVSRMVKAFRDLKRGG